MNSQSFDAKIVLLGNCGVGKTSLVYRYVHGSFTNDQPSTIGASFMTKRICIDDWQVKFQIWDTAGQERFRSMTPMYYRAASAAVLVYEIDSLDSFTAVKDWVAELRENCDDKIGIILCGNKVDKEDQRQVKTASAEEYAKTIGALCFETSALNNKGIDSLFENMARMLIEKQKSSGRRPTEDRSTLRDLNQNQQNSSGGCCW